MAALGSLDLSDASPMVNGAQLRRFVHQKVRTVIKVTDRDDSRGMIGGQMPDGASVTVKPQQGSSYGSHYVEVIGVVEDNGCIREVASTEFGNKFDHASYNQLCALVHGEFKPLFY